MPNEYEVVCSLTRNMSPFIKGDLIPVQYREGYKPVRISQGVGVCKEGLHWIFDDETKSIVWNTVACPVRGGTMYSVTLRTTALDPVTVDIFNQEIGKLKEQIVGDLAKVTEEFLKQALPTALQSIELPKKNPYACPDCQKDCGDAIILEIHGTNCEVRKEKQDEAARLELIRKRGKSGFYSGFAKDDIQFLLGKLDER